MQFKSVIVITAQKCVSQKNNVKLNFKLKFFTAVFLVHF